MEEYVNMFLELLMYLHYMKDEKVNIQFFLRGLLQTYKNRIDLVGPQTLYESIIMAMHCYELRKGKSKVR